MRLEKVYHTFVCFTLKRYRKINEFKKRFIYKYENKMCKKLIHYKQFHNLLIYKALKPFYPEYFPVLHASTLESSKVWAGYEY